MSNEKQDRIERHIDRREFFGIGLGAAAALAALPAASLLTACGSDEPSAAAPSSPAPKPAAPMPAKPAAAPPAPAAKPAAAPAAAPAADTSTQLVSEIPAAAPIVGALQYVNQSAKPDQKCSGCQLYTATSGGRGKCQLFTEGLVSEAGWCASWVATVS